jgi:hypothetical protein
MRILWTLMLLACAACGRGAASTTPIVEPTPLPSAALTLDQRYTAGDGTFAFDFPSSWIARERGERVLLGTSPEALDATTTEATTVPGQFVVGVSIVSASRLPTLPPNAGPREVLAAYTQGGSITYTVPTDLAIGSRRAARVQATGSPDETFIIAMEIESGVFAVLAGGSTSGELVNFEPTVLAIAESLRYAARGNVDEQPTSTPEVSG